MTGEMQDLRLASYLIMMVGAWYRRPSLAASGLLASLSGWFRGKLFRREIGKRALGSRVRRGAVLLQEA
jgi:hypothetical protein